MYMYLYFMFLDVNYLKSHLKKTCLDHAAVFIVLVSLFITIEFSSPDYQFVLQSGHSKCVISNHYLKGNVDSYIKYVNSSAS